uniref:Uncharacterized protein n=1 Tax=Strombidium rassoulzadegani TaxID=1082188 RepID=A0A7S3CM07_9SPIT|mmetsp:Transcript_1656/g.2928  ORF Transcript_1656/g.2928 Transcript_1656/m.2928 type:complete len:228 (+) Transcript_1656:1023-1706(+)
MMSPEAADLINRMIQLEPQHRLGCDLKSIELLKQHPFFAGVDFSEVSKSTYTGVKSRVVERLRELPGYEENKFDFSNQIVPRESLLTANFCNPNENKLILKGNLLKQNWYSKKQLRFFELYSNGQLKYYQDMKDFKGCIVLGPESKIRKTKKTTICLVCQRKNKEYTLIQPDSSQISFAQERAKGYVSMIDDWLKELNNVVEGLKHNQVVESDVQQLDQHASSEDSN